MWSRVSPLKEQEVHNTPNYLFLQEILQELKEYIDMISQFICEGEIPQNQEMPLGRISEQYKLLHTHF